jgi:hypothetical protein
VKDKVLFDFAISGRQMQVKGIWPEIHQSSEDNWGSSLRGSFGCFSWTLRPLEGRQLRRREPIARWTAEKTRSKKLPFFIIIWVNWYVPVIA